MMKIHHYIQAGLLFLPLMLIACDSGDIAENTYYSSATGQTVRLTATLTGTDAWEAGDYTIALAGFRDGSNYAVMQHTLPVSVADAVPVVLELNNLTGQVNTVEFAVTDRLRQRILTLQRITLADYPDTQDTIRMDLGSIDVSLFSCLGIYGSRLSASNGKLLRAELYRVTVRFPSLWTYSIRYFLANSMSPSAIIFTQDSGMFSPSCFPWR